jgi:hypothetical protein
MTACNSFSRCEGLGVISLRFILTSVRDMRMQHESLEVLVWKDLVQWT